MKVIILSGGSGTRLWPISRKLLPKQFVDLFSGRSLFQKTIERNQIFDQDPVVICSAEHYFLARDQMNDMAGSASMYILEPVGRNTAPAIALAALAADSEDILLVVASDHLIGKQKEYVAAVQKAGELARENFLVTFGISPTSPETGYGYIEANGHDVLSFREKPDAETAKKYLQQGNYFWNSGFFCFKAGVFLEELKQFEPEMFQKVSLAFQNSVKTETESRVIEIGREDMLAIPDNSIDYAVMEKSQRVKMVPADLGWSDLGSFDSMSKEFAADEQGNVVINEQHNSWFGLGSKNNFIVHDQRFVAAIDVEDLMIVDTPDALLVAKKGSSQKVKNVVEQLKSSGSGLHEIHTTAHRPWGTYTVLEESGAYKVKRIVVRPGKRLSLQKHFHRNEHWIIVSGTALVTKDKESFILRANESTYIEAGTVHRLENPGKIDLVMIEAQVGQYLGEDDIVRIEDDFNREKK